MNKLINDYNRGFNLKNDDLRFIDEAIRLAFSDIAKSIGGDTPRIMWGCDIGDHVTYLSIAEGAVYWNNEIWHVYPHNLVVALPLTVPLYWAFMAEADMSVAAKTDKDLLPHYPYQVRKAVASLTTNPAGSVGYVAVGEIQQTPDPVSQGPSTPQGLSGAATGATTMHLTWNASTDNVAVTGYEIWAKKYIGLYSGYFQKIGTTAVPDFTASVAQGYDYYFYVVAFDAEANKSSASDTILVINATN